MKVRKSWSPFCKQNVDGTLHYTIIYVRFQSLYYIISIIYGIMYLDMYTYA